MSTRKPGSKKDKSGQLDLEAEVVKDLEPNAQAAARIAGGRSGSIAGSIVTGTGG